MLSVEIARVKVRFVKKWRCWYKINEVVSGNSPLITISEKSYVPLDTGSVMEKCWRRIRIHLCQMPSLPGHDGASLGRQAFCHHDLRPTRWA